MSPSDQPPDVDRLARSMLMLHGDHNHDDQSESGRDRPRNGSWSKAPIFGNDPQRAAAVLAATQADKTRYLTAGLQPVDCRFCHATVNVKRTGPGHTAVQWNSDASQRCAYFAEVRAAGEPSARTRACPRLADSIEHAVAEGCLEAVSTAPPPGDG
jgi:hypothetical protein